VEFISDLLNREAIAQTIFLYSFIVAAGIFLGKLKIFGVSLGVTFVLFIGIVVSHFGFNANHQIVEFVREFGLILFVYSIGLQVGPGFFSSFRKGGLSLNLMAVGIVVSGGITTMLIHIITGTSLPMLVGIMSGAVTNTPGLGAAQNALNQVASAVPGYEVPEIGLGYAVAYPFGVLGIIITMILLKKMLSIDATKELDKFNKDQHPEGVLPEKINIQVTNEKVVGRSINEISGLINSEFVISRIFHKGELKPATSDTIICENDIILVVTKKESIPEIVKEIGSISEMDISASQGNLISRRVLVTNSETFGKSIGSLRLRTRFNITITRVFRAGIELMASPGIKFQMGDRVTIVGDEKSVEIVTGILGNSLKRLNEPNLVPIFFGIMLGVVLGIIPIRIPGIVNPLRLGLAGGPLIVAIIISKYGHRFSMVPYTTLSANLMLREMGITLFLASVGLVAGEKFIPSFVSGKGFVWMGYGAIITLIPIVLGFLFARIVLKRNYLEICGLIAGSMTDPPALAFANSATQSEAPAIAYATVYPLVMFLRIFIAQLLILLFI
jgi:putative transport protein